MLFEAAITSIKVSSGYIQKHPACWEDPSQSLAGSNIDDILQAWAIAWRDAVECDGHA